VSKDPAPQAEGLNYDEKSSKSRERCEGIGPDSSWRGGTLPWPDPALTERLRKEGQLSTRKRAYYRALKRGEKWALDEAERRKTRSGFDQLLRDYFPHNLLVKELLSVPAFLRPKPPEDCF
jgi:hypothetical protein